MRIALCVWALIAAFAPAAEAAPLTIGSPGDPANGNAAPFGVRHDGTYQQVFRAGLFSEPVWITSITWYNTIHNPGLGTISTADFEFRFSTASAAVNGLNTTNLTANVGPDDSFFASASLTGGLIGNQLTISGNAFTYDPTNGNLLLEVIRTNSSGGSGTIFMDARNGTFGTDSSRALDYPNIGGFTSYGLVTTFEITPVPEPTTMLLLGSGLVGLAGFRRKFIKK